MNKDREKSILEIVIKEKAVTVKDLARRLYVHPPGLVQLRKAKALAAHARRRGFGRKRAVGDQGTLSDTGA